MTALSRPMDAERLLEHFARIAEAPDAVPQLRRFIFNLAVRGKLVEQDPGDEPASELLNRIYAEKTRLVKEGRKGRRAELLPIEEGQRPLSVPMGWSWARLAEISRRLHYGFTASANKAINDVSLRFPRLFV